jgi:DNA adenine methylase
MSVALRAPFPYFGGKAAVAADVWRRFGNPDCYIEPFLGSAAVLLARPVPFDGVETANDADGLVANFWRALQHDPEAVADAADQPVFEVDLHARHAWLVGRKDGLQARLEGDPDFYDARAAGWWAWGLSCYIGSGFCSGNGPWQVVEAEDGSRQLVHLGNAGQGVNRQLVHLGDAGRGVNRKRVGHREGLFAYFAALAERLRHVRVCCGDWARVCGPTPLFPVSRGAGRQVTAAVFLDPPYAAEAGRQDGLYRKDSLTVAREVREWAVAHGDDPRLRVALCGYDGEHDMPAGWECVAGASAGGHGYGGQAKGGYGNAGRERIWYSSHCNRERTLFDAAEA